MTDEEFSRQKAAEEAKRERMWDPAERWRVVQEMTTWADLQRDPPRNSQAGCRKAQAEKQAFEEQFQKRQ